MGIQNKRPSFPCFNHVVDKYQLSPLPALRENNQVKLEQFICFYLLSRLSWEIPLIMEQYAECDSLESLSHSDTTWEIEIQAFIKTHYPNRECLWFGAKRNVPSFNLRSPKTYGNCDIVKTIEQLPLRTFYQSLQSLPNLYHRTGHEINHQYLLLILSKSSIVFSLTTLRMGIISIGLQLWIW